MSKISKNIYETSGHSMDTITLKSSMLNIISNRPFYSDHSTYLWAQHGNFCRKRIRYNIFENNNLDIKLVFSLISNKQAYRMVKRNTLGKTEIVEDVLCG